MMLMVKIPLFERPVIYDASQFIADLPIQKVIGDSFRRATWDSIDNGGGVGRVEVFNGGFGWD